MLVVQSKSDWVILPMPGTIKQSCKNLRLCFLAFQVVKEPKSVTLGYYIFCGMCAPHITNDTKSLYVSMAITIHSICFVPENTT